MSRYKLDHLKGDVRKIFPISLTFCFLWFLANYFYNYGLLYATITSSVVLSNTSPAFVYLLGISCLVPAARREQFDCLNAIMIFVSLTGFALIAMADSIDKSGDSSDHPVLGDILSVCSAISYALYATFFKVRVPEEDVAEFKFSYFLGFVGLCNDVFLAVLLLIFNVTGWETFEWPD